MIVGYARTSTADHTAGLDASVGPDRSRCGAGLLRTGVERCPSGASWTRRCGSSGKATFLVCTKPDRLALSTRNLLDIAENLSRRGVTLRIISMGDLDAANPTGKLMLTMLGRRRAHSSARSCWNASARVSLRPPHKANTRAVNPRRGQKAALVTRSQTEASCGSRLPARPALASPVLTAKRRAA